MTTLHVVRVFVGPGGRGGNPLGVFLDGAAIAAERRQAVTVELGFAETVFVDDIVRGNIRIFVPTNELPFAGHPSVGTAWLLREVGTPVAVLRPPAGDVPVRYEGDRTWIRARPEWVPGAVRIVELGTAAEVAAHPGQEMGEPWLYVWAWKDEASGRLRSRSFPTEYGILEDEASGAASVAMGARLRRPLTIHQGIGSEILVRPHDDGTVEIGGRTEMVEMRKFP
ncbi:MAG: PhzF family phenazine biosynthesis protein [Nocardioidaceae bacterium]|nr:PhzF family phenazine biosynthesis protein [Nocardioidaceae bacterium]